MLEAYRTIPPEEREGLSVEEFIVILSEYLPEEVRRNYYDQSPKLQQYVRSSEDERLRELYP
jgi:hypothetical protein